MARTPRWIIPGLAYHVVQRGSNKQDVFRHDDDRNRFFTLLAAAAVKSETSVLAYCLMTNHVHLVLRPQRGDSLTRFGRQAFGLYAQWFNMKYERCGALWQNRFFSCPLDPRHLDAALAYVENNPVRAGIVRTAREYCWSSAAAHLGLAPFPTFLDRNFWREVGVIGWISLLSQVRPDAATIQHHLRRCTSAGRPFASEEFIAEMEQKFNRQWHRWPYDQELSDLEVACAMPASAGKRGR